MKKFRKLIPALAMLLVSAVLMSTASYAWFSMNTTVTATNMQVKAVSDQGILINVESAGTSAYWSNATTTSQTEGILLHATSTANTSAWYVAHSKITGSAAEATANTQSTDLVDGYHILGTAPYATAVEPVAAVPASKQAKQEITYVDTGASGYTNGEGYYVKYTYYLKSSAEAITTSLAANGQNLNITASVGTIASATSGNLDKALRVAVVIEGRAYIFAPIVGADASYFVAAGETATTAIAGTAAAGTAGSATSPTNVLTIPAVTADNGIPAYVYIYFEGEDINLKTDNALATLDNLTVSVTFSLVKNDAAIGTAPGVALS